MKLGHPLRIDSIGCCRPGHVLQLLKWYLTCHLLTGHVDVLVDGNGD